MLLTTTQETLEITGLIIFSYALTSYIDADEGRLVEARIGHEHQAANRVSQARVETNTR